MTAPIRPGSTKAFQREKWVFTATIASILAPTSAEVGAAGNLDVSCYLFDSTARPTQNTNRVTLTRRICDGAVYEQIGTTTYTGGDMMYAVDPQAASATTGKKALEKFPEGTTGYLIRRLGIDVNTDLATGQFVDVFPVAFGPAMPTTVGDTDSAEVAITQAFAVTGPPAFIKAIVA